jgi:pheromone shutdown-related protein TraB
MADASELDGPRSASSGNVTRIERNGKEIYLLGTAHVSRKSVEEVQRTIDEIRPDSVCVELDRTRYEMLADEGRFGRVDLAAIIAAGRAGLYLSSLLFAGFQKRIGDRLGVRPGAEMLAAVEAAKGIGAEIVFADRDVQATLMRCYRSLGFVTKAQVLFVLVMLPFAVGDVDEEEIERLKKRETIGDVMTTFAEQMPSLKTPLIDERDRYLAASIVRAPGRRVVAVVGAAHVPGIENRIGEETDTAALDVIPPPSGRVRILQGIFPVFGLALVLATAVGRVTPGLALSAVVRATAPSAGLAAVLALVAGASVLTVLLCIPLAPLTLIMPLVRFDHAIGTFETRVRPPTSTDGLRARDDVLSPARARKSRFLRPLLAAVLGSFGRVLGATVGLVWAILHLL